MKRKVIALVVVCLALSAEIGIGAAQNNRRQIRSARRPIANQYIVLMATNDDAEAVGRQYESLYVGRLRHVYRSSVRGFAIRLNRAAAQALADDPRIASVEEDGTVEIADTQTGPPWGLDRIDQRSLPLDTIYSYRASQRTVHVHVIDTGIRTTHVEFGGRASIAGDFVDDDGDGDPNDIGNDDANPSTPDGQDCNGHGTHVAGTIGGSTYGVAKNVQLHAYRALNCSGSGSISGVIAAVDAVTADTRRPAVANMSLAGDPSAALDAAVQRSIAAGVTYVIAAGNSSVDASTMSPARVPQAITVGATDSTDAKAAFSNFGATVDIFAPGVGINSSWYTSDTASGPASGTSMASPHVAGVAALYLDQMGDKPPQVVRDAIVAAATTGVVTNGGAGSPNALLYPGFTNPAAPPPPAPPTVQVTSPIEGATATAPATFTVSANAADSDGTVTDVAFYGDSVLLGHDSAAPFSLTWSGVGAGAHTVTAVATDNSGLQATSATVNVTVTSSTSSRVNVALASNGGVATASSIYYSAYGASGVNNGDRKGTNFGYDGGWNDGTYDSFPDWLEIAFNGSKAIDEVDVFAVQDSYANPIEPTPTTTVTFFGPADFTVQYWAGTQWLAVPGGVVRNNALVWRKFTFAPLTTTRIRVLVERGQGGWSRLAEVEAYAGAAAPPPPPPPAPVPPTVQLTSPADGAVATAPAAFTVSANASDADGTIADVAFYADTTLIGHDAVAPFSLTWSAVPAGTYRLTAVATDNSGAQTTSPAVTVTVTGATGPRVNVALASNGGVASASSIYYSAYDASGVNNGDRKGANFGYGGGWNDGTYDSFPDWLEIAFNGSKTIGEVDVFAVQDSYANPIEPTPTTTVAFFGPADFTVQYWTGAQWLAVPGGVVRNNALVWRKFTFAPLTTTRIRVLVERGQGGWSRLAEVEAY